MDGQSSSNTYGVTKSGGQAGGGGGGRTGRYIRDGDGNHEGGRVGCLTGKRAQKRVFPKCIRHKGWGPGYTSHADWVHAGLADRL